MMLPERAAEIARLLQQHGHRTEELVQVLRAARELQTEVGRLRTQLQNAANCLAANSDKAARREWADNIQTFLAGGGQ